MTQVISLVVHAGNIPKRQERASCIKNESLVEHAEMKEG
jgi:hypothetical protein